MPFLAINPTALETEGQPATRGDLGAPLREPERFLLSHTPRTGKTGLPTGDALRGIFHFLKNLSDGMLVV